MKRLIVLMLVLALALNVSAISSFQEVKASILKYEPTPAEQGKTVDVWVQLSNSGTKADKGFVKFVPEYPFTLPQGQSEEVEVGAIAATETKVVKFTVFVDPNAPNGDSMIKFWYKFGATTDWVELETPITLQTQDASLVVDSYKVTPSPVVPGQMVNVDMLVRNAGRIAVKNVDVGIDLEDGKFSIVGTGAMKRLSYIGAGETETISFKLASDTSTEVKVYSIPVKLLYQDDRNKQYDETAKISLIVNAQPEISMTVDSTDFTSKTTPGTVSIKVVNRGVVDLKYVTVTLLPSNQYELLSSSNEAYVGNLDNDDFETVDFLIKPLVTSPALSVQLDFKDPYNVDFSKQYQLPVRIITPSDLGQGGSSFGTILFVLIVIGIGIWYWRKRKSKK